jgi:hypothetical protein
MILKDFGGFVFMVCLILGGNRWPGAFSVTPGRKIAQTGISSQFCYSPWPKYR